MARKNLFKGHSIYVDFAKKTYALLMRGGWVTYADVMAEQLGVKSPKDLPYSISNCDDYNKLKQAFPDVCRTIREMTQDDECIVTEGGKLDKRFRYVGKDKDPLADLLKDSAAKELKEYWDFCQDSAGFFPQSWLDYFFFNSKDLLDMKQKKHSGQQLINASLDCKLKNIDLLPKIYSLIKARQVIRFDYKPFSEDVQHLVFHPHYLKEYNGRWHLYGHAEDREPEIGYDISLDRIESSLQEDNKTKYIPAPKGYYHDFFAKRMGVSSPIEGMEDHAHIRARIYNRNVYKLIETRPIHDSQTIVTEYDTHNDGEYGELTFDMVINKELVGHILHWGEDVKILEPKSLKIYIKEKIRKMAEYYAE